MAKCLKCGKKGLFLKLTKEKVCTDCVWQSKVDELEKLLLPEQRDIIMLKLEIKKLEEIKNRLGSQSQSLQESIRIHQQEIESKKKEIIILDDEILYQSFGLYTPLYDFAKSEDYKDRLERVRATQKGMVKEDTVCFYPTNWTLNNSASQGKRMIKNSVKQIVRCFNVECDEVVDKVKFNNIESMREKINKSYEQLNKLNEFQQIRINPLYRNLKIDELNLSHEYQLKKQQEKEELKEQRAALREQAKLEQEIREARLKLEKDKKHFENAITDTERKLKFATSDAEKADLQEKLNTLELQIGKLKDDEKAIDYREQNAKAGYVYVISNVGAFGEDVFKIGMTRRLEPMERIEELSDASVPFSFDVHALIFSENAPELESKLHRHFEKGRVNMINNRKEFYKANISEIESIIKKSYDKTVDIIKTPPAEQYRESLKLKELA